MYNIKDALRSGTTKEQLLKDYEGAIYTIDARKVSEEALDLLDLSLNRGGDQVAVKLDGKVTFYGAKQEAIERRKCVYTPLPNHHCHRFKSMGKTCRNRQTYYFPCVTNQFCYPIHRSRNKHLCSIKTMRA